MSLSKFPLAACALAVLLASCARPAHQAAGARATPVTSPAAVVSEARVPTAPPVTQESPATPAPSAAPSIAPATGSVAVPAVAPKASSAAAPSAAPTLAPTAEPSATRVHAPTPTPTRKLVPIRAADAPPQIVSISISQSTMHPGQTISGTVVTSSNVASVELRVASYSIDMQKTGVGRFAMAYTVPNIPVAFRGSYTMQIIARNSAGDQASRGIPITIR
ncbi:MAG: hypothetical protein ACYDGM_11380 [Vulcanimicrobiaceae bacterium]